LALLLKIFSEGDAFGLQRKQRLFGVVTLANLLVGLRDYCRFRGNTPKNLCFLRYLCVSGFMVLLLFWWRQKLKYNFYIYAQL